MLNSCTLLRVRLVRLQWHQMPIPLLSTTLSRATVAAISKVQPRHDRCVVSLGSNCCQRSASESSKRSLAVAAKLCLISYRSELAPQWCALCLHVQSYKGTRRCLTFAPAASSNGACMMGRAYCEAVAAGVRSLRQHNRSSTTAKRSLLLASTN
jgi:hypothetical protein